MNSVKLSVRTIIIFIVGALLLVGCAAGDAEDKVIKIGKAPYDYEEPVLEVTKLIAAELGYEVEVVEGDVGFMFLALRQGDIDIWPGIWLPAIHRSYQEDFGDDYELGSAIFRDAPTGWVVPQYVEADTIDDLVDNEDIVNKKLIGLEPGAGMMLVSEETIEGYGLEIELVSGSMAAMLAEVDYAVTNGEPILFLGWRPHTMFTNYDLKVLEDTEGYWEIDSYYWGIRHGFAGSAPEIYDLVKNFEMSIDDNESFIYELEKNNADIEVLAQQWIDEHRADIDAWLGK